MEDPGVWEAEFVFFSVGEDHQLIRRIDSFPMANEIPRPIMLPQRKMAGAFFLVEDYLSRHLRERTAFHRGDRVCSTLIVSDGGWIDAQETVGELSSYISKYKNIIWVTSDPEQFPPESWRKLLSDYEKEEIEYYSDNGLSRHCIATWPNNLDDSIAQKYGLRVFRSDALNHPFFWNPP
jgi:hypothetical protein